MKIDRASLPELTGTRYPPPYNTPCLGRVRQRLGEAAGITQFGVNLLRLPPEAWSSQIHRHATEDEFIYVLEGEVWLVGENSEEQLRQGCAGFAHDGPAHHLQNRSAHEATVLEVGTRKEVDTVVYPGIDLRYETTHGGYLHTDGTPY